MKKISFLTIFLLPVWLSAQFSLAIQPVDFPDAPPAQSYAWAQHEGRWLIIGGRIDGLHRRQPFAAFTTDGNNNRIYVIDPAARQVWSAPVDGLPVAAREQLQSTNMEFAQKEGRLFLVGGYAYSPSAADHITFPYLTEIQVPALIDAIIAGASGLSAYITTLADERMAVTGGYLHLLGDQFYLVGGHRFDGRYNPHGPDHGPGFFQDYTDEVRRFRVEGTGTELTVTDYEAWHDELHLHRRDYNLVPQIFPDGSAGLTAFSGVFQHNVDLPFTNTVDITSQGYAVNDEFTQYLCHYHAAHLPVYESGSNAMHTLFFGGLSQFYLDDNGNLVEDTEVPFVRTISRVTRSGDGSMTEEKMPEEMPGFLGASAEFIPAAGVPFDVMGILQLDALPVDSAVLVGYIYGGIESSARNVFFLNGDDLSWASNYLHAVYLTRTATTSTGGLALANDNPLTVAVFPNPANRSLTVRFRTPAAGEVFFLIMDAEGKLIDQLSAEAPEPAQYDTELALDSLPPGVYVLNVNAGKYQRSVRFVKHLK